MKMKMKMKKKLVSLGLVVAMIASMTGCGNKTDGVSSEISANEVVATENATNEEEEITCSLTVWGPAEDQDETKGNWLPTMCEQFSAEHPNWHITFEYGTCQEGEAKKNVTQDVEGAADVYMFANDNITDLVSNNALSELGGKALESIQMTNNQTVIDSVTFEGAVYGFPFTTNTWYMYYDKSVFSEEDVKSLDTMIEKGKVAFPLTNSWYMPAFYLANGGTMFGDNQMDEEAGIDFGGVKAAEVTNYLVDLVANPNFLNDTDGSGLAGLSDGTVNAIFSGSWDAIAVKEALGDNMGVATLPTINIGGKECQMKSFAGSKAIGVNPTCENQQVAVALAQYLASAEAQQAHYEMRQIVPCNKELLSQDAFLADPIVAVQNYTYENNSITQPFVTAMGFFWTPADNMGKNLVSGDITHENAEERTEEFNTAANTDVAEDATGETEDAE